MFTAVKWYINQELHLWRESRLVTWDNPQNTMSTILLYMIEYRKVTGTLFLKERIVHFNAVSTTNSKVGYIKSKLFARLNTTEAKWENVWGFFLIRVNKLTLWRLNHWSVFSVAIKKIRLKKNGDYCSSVSECVSSLVGNRDNSTPSVASWVIF